MIGFVLELTFHREFKLQICEEVESGLKTQAQVSREHSLTANLISRWLREYRRDPVNCFLGKGKYQLDTRETKIKKLEADLGRFTYENQILKEVNALLKKASINRRFIK